MTKDSVPGYGSDFVSGGPASWSFTRVRLEKRLASKLINFVSASPSLVRYIRYFDIPTKLVNDLTTLVLLNLILICIYFNLESSS